MSGRDWLRYSSAYLIIFVLIGGLWAWESFSDYQQRHTDERQNAAEHEARASHQQWQAECFRIPVPSGSLCEFYPHQPEPDAERANYDLRAQQEMAEWALGVLFATLMGLAIAVAGVVFVALTLRAAVDANKGFADVAKRELRAYIRVKPVKGIVAAGTIPTFSLQVINYGKTMAQDVAVGYSVVVRKHDWVWPKNINAPDESSPSITVHPGEDPIIDARPGVDEPISEDGYKLIQSGDCCVFVRVFAFYKDVFGEGHWTVFCAEYSGEDCVSTGHLRIAKTGNRAT